VETNRLEAFSDGVFAIAITLLILGVELPRGGGSLGHELAHLWPAYVAYAVSFLTIGIMWVNHHDVFRQIGRVDRTFLLINVLFLMFIAFLPFPTRVVADHIKHPEGRQAAAIVYGVTMIGIAVGYGAIWFYAAIGRRLLRPDADPRVVSGISRSFAPGVPAYTVSTLVALVSPIASLAMFAGLALFYVLSSSVFGRDEPTP
jgi:uncharacterized membrane protein